MAGKTVVYSFHEYVSMIQLECFEKLSAAINANSTEWLIVLSLYQTMKSRKCIIIINTAVSESNFIFAE